MKTCGHQKKVAPRPQVLMRIFENTDKIFRVCRIKPFFEWVGQNAVINGEGLGWITFKNNDCYSELSLFYLFLPWTIFCVSTKLEAK